MQSLAVVKQFDVSEYVRLYFLYCIVFLSVNQLLLEACKKAFHNAKLLPAFSFEHAKWFKHGFKANEPEALERGIFANNRSH